MKGNDKLIAALNSNLANEFNSIQQYLVHAGIAKNWGYNKLAKYIKSRANEERSHSQALIKRILFLEGKPVVNKLNSISISMEHLVNLYLIHINFCYCLLI